MLEGYEKVVNNANPAISRQRRIHIWARSSGFLRDVSEWWYGRAWGVVYGAKARGRKPQCLATRSACR